MPPRPPSLSALRALRACTKSSPSPEKGRSNSLQHARRNICVQLSDDSSRDDGRQPISPYSSESAPSQHNIYLRPSTPRLRLHRRPLSHLATVTSVNAIPHVPSALHDVHAALKMLEQRAINYVNITQLSLALRGLESEDPTIRVALLSLGARSTLTRLAKALLADPLEGEQAWEKELLTDSTGGAILLRYGEEFAVERTSPLLKTIKVPSAFLRNRRLELLLHQLDTIAPWQSNAEINLATRLDTLLALDLGGTSGNSTRMLYPVHRSFVVGSGLTGVAAIVQGLEGSVNEGDSQLHGVIDVPWQDAAAETDLSGISVVNVAEAEAAITSFRQSLENVFKYEHGRLNSNIEALLEELSKGLTTKDQPLKPVLRNYIDLVLRGVDGAVSQEEADRLVDIAGESLTPVNREELVRTLNAWAEFAHTELRDEVHDALNSRLWKKIAWWKLIWRVDDIGLVMSEMLQRSYLVNAERYLQWVGGCFHASGLQLADHEASATASLKDSVSAPARVAQFGRSPDDAEVVDMVRQDLLDTQRRSTTTPFASAASSLNAADDTTVTIPALMPTAPWPQQIAASRNALLAQIPPLQRRAQGIVLRTLTTTGLSTAIGALAYVGVSDTTGYSAGAVAAFGTAWAFTAAQKEWNACKDAWVEQAQLEGKRVLEACERRGRILVDERAWAEEKVVDLTDDGAEERREAREAVAHVREALETLTALGISRQRD